MTDNQFYALITAIATGCGLIGAAIRFTGNRLIAALDKNSETMLENTKSNAVLSTKIDAVSTFVERADRRLPPTSSPPNKPNT